MGYKEHAIKVVVSEDDSEVFIQALTDALERMQEVQGVTLFSTEWGEASVPEPENAAETGAAGI